MLVKSSCAAADQKVLCAESLLALCLPTVLVQSGEYGSLLIHLDVTVQPH